MPPFAQDLQYLASACQSLEDYILSDHLYWPMDVNPAPGGGQESRLTIGLLYFIMARIMATVPAGEHAEGLSSCRSGLEKIRRKWRVAWGVKAAGEFKSRLRLWNQFISETKTDKEEFQTRYRTEVRNRAILQMLLLDLPADANDLVLALHNLDESLKALLPEGDFVWDSQLQPAFPAEKFWFLYREIKQIGA